VCEDERLPGCLEVAVFVENIVSRKQAFVARFLDFSVEADGGGVVEASPCRFIIQIDIAENGRDGPRLGGDPLERVEIVRNELLLEEQVSGRVARNNQFRKNNVVRSLGNQFLVGSHDPLFIILKIADGCIYLG